jgi:hypothetical protein
MCGAVAINRDALKNILQGKAKTNFMKGGDGEKTAVETSIRLAILAMAYHTDRRTFTIGDLLAFGKEEIEDLKVLSEDARDGVMEAFHGLHPHQLEAVITNGSYHVCLSYDKDVKDITITDRGASSINKAKAV